MLNTQEIRHLSCYAVLKAGYAGKNHLLPHMRLVLSLMNKKDYLHVEIQTLWTDLMREHGCDINYDAMKKILSLATGKGSIDPDTRYAMKSNAQARADQIDEVRP